MATAVGRSAAARRALALHRRLMRFGEAESTVTEPWVDRGTSVQAVAAHLARLWTSPTDGDESRVTEKGMSHARASVLNLIVMVPDEASATRVVETMTGLGVRHPSRAIVLAADPKAGGPTLNASITAHCNAGPEGAEPICFEVVVLTVHGEAAEHLTGIVAPLLIHDLPTHVWWPGDPPFADPIFDQLVEMGDRVVVDSDEFGDLLLGMRRLTTLRRRSGVGDLAWRRLAWWQELTAEFFDAPRFRRYLPNLNRLIIRYAIPRKRKVRRGRKAQRASQPASSIASPLAGPMLYAGWIASRIEWRRHSTTLPLEDGRLRLKLEGRHEMVDLQIEPVETDALPPGELVAVRLRAFGETGAAEFIIERSAGEAVVASNADGMTALLRRMPMEQATESELLAADLVVDQHDPVYEAAVRAAAVFLASARQVDLAG
ncbi:MAG TPA: glucose-6-phosphate dehydrogenase assembly protein OpcA [Candidatus Limnocylindria bacterium]|jgi:glucose-6-phosphate dehydrogenase assembly protein OpcA|nr:glucose-6-phosphate dehydrogenase assembly protein OpcA [Candidatus Limnocylindria bacterium]